MHHPTSSNHIGHLIEVQTSKLNGAESKCARSWKVEAEDQGIIQKARFEECIMASLSKPRSGNHSFQRNSPTPGKTSRVWASLGRPFGHGVMFQFLAVWPSKMRAFCHYAGSISVSSIECREDERRLIKYQLVLQVRLSSLSICPSMSFAMSFASTVPALSLPCSSLVQWLACFAWPWAFQELAENDVAPYILFLAV